MRLTISVVFLLWTNLLLSQVSTFPHTQNFEQAFTVGTDVVFIPNYIGNEVAITNRIFQGSDGLSGNSLNIIPTSTFSGQIDISANFSGVNNPKVTFYAYSKQNGSSSSDRPAILTFSTSIDGGNTFLDDVQIGDDSTFPNDNLTSYTEYEYELPVAASGESNTVIRITASRGSGSGSAAELVIDDLSIEEQVLPLAISGVSATAATEVVVTFNQDVSQATAENAANYTLNNGISVSSASLSASNQVTLTTSNMPNNNYELTVNNVEDLASNTPANNLQGTFSYIEALSISNVSVLSKNSLEVTFNLDLDETSAETLSNYTVDKAIDNPSSATLNSTENNKVLLTFSTDFTENTFELTVNGVTDESTLANTTNLTEDFSYLPLGINSASAVSATEIVLVFNQDLDNTSAETASNYTIDFGRGSPTSVMLDGSDASKVTLTIANAMVNNTYTVSVNNVKNLAGNTTAANLTTEVDYETPTFSRQIVINELFADPTGDNPPVPTVLPTGSSEEFVELYNTTSEAIDITGFSLSGGTIGNFVLGADSYVILTSTSNLATYQGFGDAVVVSSWNSLTNGGEQLLLTDNLGNLVDSLTYNTDWYGDESKADGGWTLEQINPALACSDINNWSASTSVNGGTPGLQNSIYDTTPDTEGPNLVSVTISTPQEIVVTFDEIMDAASLGNGTYTLNNGASVSSASPNTPSLRSVTLALAAPMVSGTIYTLNISGQTDCAGNAAETTTIDFLFDNEAPVFERFVLKDSVTLDLIFDEALAETIAETEANFSINAGIGSPKTAKLNDSQANRVHLTLDNPLSIGSNYTLTYQQLTDTLGNTVFTSNEGFAFINQIDTVIVISEQLLDVYFEAAVNEASAENLFAYQVDESIGSPATATLDAGNDKLVHLVFGTSFPENDELVIDFEDIQDASLNYLQLLNTEFIYDTDDPDLDTIIVIDENSIELFFDESLGLTSAESINHYTVNNGHGNPSAATLQPGQKSVVLDFATNFEQEVENRITYTSIADLSGNAISTNRGYNFTYDRLAPRLNSIKLTSPTTLRVEFSEEVVKSIAENPANYSVSNGLGNPTQALRSEEFTNVVTLTFADLGNYAENTLTISNIADLFTNDLATTLSASFSTLTPNFGTFTILTDTSIQVQFTKPLTQASAEEVENYGFDKGIGTFTLEQDSGDPSIVRLYLTIPLKPEISYRMVVDRLEDLDGNLMPPTHHDFTYDSQLDAVNILNEHTLVLNFSTNVDETAAETLTNFSLNNGIGSPISAVRSTNDSSQVTLLFAQDFQESSTYTLSVFNQKTIFGGVIPGSRTTLDYDVTAPVILAVNSYYTNQIEVVFDETLKRTTAQTLNHYSLNNGIGQPTAAYLQADGKSVLLTFANALSDATVYQLSSERVEDSQGKAMTASTFDFTFTAPVMPNFRDIVINEIYFDNDFKSAIPNYEFVELYNRSASNINLREFYLTDKNDTAHFGNVTLNTGEFLIVSGTTAGSLFQAYGNAVGLANFPSLNNTGEIILLLDRDLNVVDSIAYNTSYYNDEEKADGGFTVELINPEKPCFDVANYAASTHPDGGTPGTQNSVFDNSADNAAPALESLTVLSTTALQLTFSESLDISTLISDNFSLTGTSTVASVTVNEIFGTDVTLTLSSAFETGLNHTLTISGITDCSGNALTTTASFSKGATPQVEDFLITEIMATPAPSNGLPEREYIEIFNNSNKILSTEDLFLKDDKAAVSIGSYDVAPQTYVILTSTAGSTEMAAYGTSIGISSFPNYTIDDEVSLERADGTTIFNVDYDKTYYQDENKEDGGYSMEMVNLAPACFDQGNWGASSAALGGTPGSQNSIFDDSPDVTAPTVTSFEVIDESNFAFTFSESMNLATLIPANFDASGDLTVSEVNWVDEFGQAITVSLATPFTDGTEFTISISGVEDCAGNSMATETFSFASGDEPQPFELLITEIMANPTPSAGLPEAEYVEIYNASNKILSLDGVVLADKVSASYLANSTIKPGEYLILTPSANASSFEAYGDVMTLLTWPNLNNDSDKLSLYNKSGDQIFTLTYAQSWYRSQSKSSGGYSLEMIDLNYPCVEEGNWTATESTNGGTPGTQNAVYGNNPDNAGPELVQAVSVDESTILLTFNEKLGESSIDLTDFSANQGLSFIAYQLNEDNKSIQLTTASDLQASTVYQIAVQNLTDCTGNLISATNNSDEIVVASEASPLDIVVNEVLFNPNSGGVRFVECYNQSNKYINLKGWKIAGKGNTKTIVTEDYILAPAQYFVVTNDADVLASEYSGTVRSRIIEISSMPTMADDNGAAILLSASMEEIDRFDYDESYHSPLLDDNEGVSLERIRFSGESNDPNNWYSASSGVDYATPGYVNSQSRGTNQAVATVALDPPTFAPELAGVANFTTINYNFKSQGNMLNVSIYDANGNLIKRIAQNKLVGNQPFFAWDGTTEQGGKARVGYYLVLTEVISANGKVDYLKEKVAIGSRF